MQLFLVAFLLKNLEQHSLQVSLLNALDTSQVPKTYFIIIQKIPQYAFIKANRRQPYDRRRLLLSLIFSSFPCFPKNLSLILEVF